MTALDTQRATGFGAPVAVAGDDLAWHGIGRVGIRLRDMSFHDPQLNFNLRVAIGITAADGFSPRHRHTFEQIRYYIDGPAKFGDVIYQPGDCVYFPEGVAYGPQSGHNDQDSLHVTLQFSGPAGIYYPTPDEQEHAQAEMAARGAFAGGKYFHADGREQDAFEATIEHITGTKVAYPPPRYDRPLRMRVPAYRAEPLHDDPRVTVRKLAAFNEAGPAIRFIEAGAGAALAGGTQPYCEVRLLVRGGVGHDGRTFVGQSCFFFPANVPFPKLDVTEDAHILSVGFGANVR